MKTTKKSLWLSAVSMILCVVLLLGTTFAWFTDSVINKGNTIQAGSLTMGITYRPVASTGAYSTLDENTALFQDVTWEPGKSEGYEFKIRSNGSLAFLYQMELANVSAAPAQGVDIADVLEVYTAYGNGKPTSIDDMDYVGTVAELRNSKVVFSSSKVMQSGWEDVFYVVIKMKDTADNDYQKQSVMFDLLFRAKQAEYETDGFGSSEYDKDAAFTNTVVVSSETFEMDKGDWSAGTVKDGVLIPEAGAYSKYGEYRTEYPGPWTASVDVYLDTKETNGSTFLLSNAVTRTTGEHLRDYVFTFRRIGEKYVVLTGNGSEYANSGDDYLDSIKQAEITASGWYTLSWSYDMVDGALACTMRVVNTETGEVALEKVLTSKEDTADVVGFNRYLWVLDSNTFQAVPMDNQTLTVVE